MKLVSFNINSIRPRIHQLEKIIADHQPDVIALQETKVDDPQFPLDKLDHLGYHLYFHGQKAHYGVATLSKQPALAVYKGFPDDSDDAQKRLITIELMTEQGKMTIINGYFPQGESNSHPIKYPAKRQFYQNLIHYIKDNNYNNQLTAIMGDMNICSTDLDIGIGDENKKRWLRGGKCSFLPEERQWLNELLELGFVDTFRQQHSTCGDQYSWFDYRSRGFDDNRGLRIDLILASPQLAELCNETGIDHTIRAMEKPSDHAPIWSNFTLTPK